jgi:MFS family permease
MLYVVVFLLGVGEAAYDNAAQSLLPQVVADAALEKANSTLAIVEQAGLDLVGPALGGVIFTTTAALPFGMNSLGLIIGAALIARIPVARRPAGARPSARAFLPDMGAAAGPARDRPDGPAARAGGDRDGRPGLGGVPHPGGRRSRLGRPRPSRSVRWPAGRSRARSACAPPSGSAGWPWPCWRRRSR